MAADSQPNELNSKPYAYPLPGCLTCGDRLDEHTVKLFHADRELKFCCIECVAHYTTSPEAYVSFLEEQIRKAQRDNYPLSTCLVSNHELGSMGDPIEYVSGNTLIKFCCVACVEEFEKNREQMLNKLNDAKLGKPSDSQPKKEH